MAISRNLFIKLSLLFAMIPMVCYSQTPSRQEYLNASATLAQNYELFLSFDPENIDHMNVAQVLISDMMQLVEVVEVYERYRASKIISTIDSLEDQANSVVRTFSVLNVSQMDDQIVSQLSRIENLSAQKNLYQQNLRNISRLRERISAANTFLNNVGNTLSVIDSTLKARTYIETIQSDAGSLEKYQAESDFVLSAATTSLAIAAPNALPPVAIASAATATAGWLIDTAGDEVREGVEERVSNYYQIVSEAEQNIKTYILNAHEYGQPYTSPQLSEVVESELISARYKLKELQNRPGGEISSTVFGVRKTEEEALEHALFLVNTLLDGRAFRRAIIFNNDVTQAVRDIEALSAMFASGQEVASNFDLQITTALRSEAKNNLPLNTDERLANTFQPDEVAQQDEPVEQQSATNTSDTSVEDFSSTEQERLEQERQAELDRLETERRQEDERRIAEERRREAERQADLEEAVTERGELDETKAKTEHDLQEARNLVTVLRYQEAEKAQNELRDIASEIQSLRDRKQASVGFDNLKFRQGVLRRELQDLQTAIRFRRAISSPSDVTAQHKRALNRLAQKFGIRASGSQEAWQRLLLSADRLMRRRINEFQSLNTRIAEIEAAGEFTAADERRFQRLLRREQDLERRLDTLSSRLRIAETNVDRLNRQLRGINQDISDSDREIASLRRDGDVIDLTNFNVQAYAKENWESYSIYDDYGQTSDNGTADTSDESNETAVGIASAVDPDNPTGTVTLPGGITITGPTDPGPTDPTDPVDPVDPPVQPTVTLRGSFSYTGADGRTTSSQTHWRGGMVGPLTTGSDGGNLLTFHIGSYSDVGAVGTVRKMSAIDSSFSDNLSWGRWAGTYSPGGPGACTQDPDGSLYCGVRDYTGGLWIVGTPSTSSQFALRTGTASYRGGFMGDFDNGTSIEQGKVSGDFQLNVDFASRALTGNAEFSLDNGATVWDYASISGNLDATQEDPMLWGTLTSTGPGLSFGSSGSMSGRFYGSNSNEIAGAFSYTGIGGSATGIWAGHEGPFTTGEQWEGFLAAKVTGQSALFTRSGVVIDGNSSNAPTAGQDTFTTNGLSPGITTGTTKGDYTYTAWGQWNGSGVTIDSQPIEQANIVIGRLTQPTDMPSSGTRNFGDASHNSQVAGIGFNGEQIAGTISLGADFSNGHVGGQFDFTADGNQWVNGTISNTPIQGNRFNGNGSNMNINQGGSGNLNGAFFGDSAQEVAGEWAIWNVPGAVSGADGVFRAKQ